MLQISKEEKQDDKAAADTTEKASEEFLNAIFGGSDDSDTDDTDDSDDATEDDERNNDQNTAAPTSKDLPDDKTTGEVASETAAAEEKVITIMDIPLKEDENEQFGPALPPTLSNESKPYVAVKTEPQKEIGASPPAQKEAKQQLRQKYQIQRLQLHTRRAGKAIYHLKVPLKIWASVQRRFYLHEFWITL
ncbi:unnamed protein product [Gongylonema pulchrum]|uniref:Nucleolin-like n=1 Tax=Gongylonema pulchrum TaxID=637853 RepID=A0A183DXL0_9BILA|nr:unnamed protein product [Gongylonema pulchrum]